MLLVILHYTVGYPLRYAVLDTLLLVVLSTTSTEVVKDVMHGIPTYPNGDTLRHPGRPTPLTTCDSVGYP